MPYTDTLSQEVAIPNAGIFPVLQAVGTVYTPWQDMSILNQAEFELLVGVLSATGTVDFCLMGASTASGNGTVITGTSITQLTAGSQIATILITAEKLNVLGLGYRYVKGRVTLGTAGGYIAVGSRGKDFSYGAAGVSGASTTGYNNDPTVAQQILLTK